MYKYFLFLIVDQSSIIWKQQNVFINSSVARILSCLQFLTTTNKSALIICITNFLYLCIDILLFSPMDRQRWIDRARAREREREGWRWIQIQIQIQINGLLSMCLFACQFLVNYLLLILLLLSTFSYWALEIVLYSGKKSNLADMRIEDIFFKLMSYSFS